MVKIEIFVAIKEDTQRYYLLKVVRRDFDVYCIPPNLGVHFTLHESGMSHFRSEGNRVEIRGEPSVALVMGEAGACVGKDIVRASLKNLTRASSICTLTCLINTLSHDFQRLDRSVRECFVIDKDALSKDKKGIEVGIWAVPASNKIGFEFNNPNIPANSLYKVSQCEPQIWIYYRPFE